jgi:hypothetical protein
MAFPFVSRRQLRITLFSTATWPGTLCTCAPARAIAAARTMNAIWPIALRLIAKRMLCGIIARAGQKAPITANDPLSAASGGAPVVVVMQWFSERTISSATFHALGVTAVFGGRMHRGGLLCICGRGWHSVLTRARFQIWAPDKRRPRRHQKCTPVRHKGASAPSRPSKVYTISGTPDSIPVFFIDAGTASWVCAQITQLAPQAAIEMAREMFSSTKTVLFCGRDSCKVFARVVLPHFAGPSIKILTGPVSMSCLLVRWGLNMDAYHLVRGLQL